MSGPLSEQAWWRPETASQEAGSGSHATGRHPVAFWALMAFTLVLLLAPQSYFPVLSPLHLAFLSAITAGLAYIYGRLSDHEPLIQLTAPLIAVILLVVWTVVTIPFSLWPGGAFSFLLEIFIKAVIVFWLLGTVVNTVRRLWIAGWILSLIAIPLSVSAVLKMLSGGFSTEQLSQGLDRITGYEAALTTNPNDLALMLNLILPIVFALLFISRRVGARVILTGIALLIVLAVIATYSRSGFVTLGVIGLAYMVVLWRGGRRGLAISIVLVMMAWVPFLPSSYLTRLGTITNVQADATGSAQTRVRDMLAASKYVVNHPLVGAGIGQDILALNEVRGTTWTKVHNVYLEYAVDLGLPGLGLYLVLLYWILRSIYRVMTRPATTPEQRQLRLLAEGIGVSLTAFAVAALFYPDAYEFYFYYMAGLAVAAHSIANRQNPDAQRSARASTV